MFKVWAKEKLETEEEVRRATLRMSSVAPPETAISSPETGEIRSVVGTTSSRV